MQLSVGIIDVVLKSVGFSAYVSTVSLSMCLRKGPFKSSFANNLINNCQSDKHRSKSQSSMALTPRTRPKASESGNMVILSEMFAYF